MPNLYEGKYMRLLLVMLLIARAGYAATSGTLILQGTVASVNSISIVPSNNLTLNILNGESAKNVAAVTEVSNNPLGYTISLSSANAGALKNGSIVGTAYTLSYDGGAYLGPLVTPVTVKTVGPLSALVNNISNILINVVANPTTLSGTYSDTVTLAITAL